MLHTKQSSRYSHANHTILKCNWLLNRVLAYVVLVLLAVLAVGVLMPAFAEYTSPAKQVREGTPLNQIQCNNQRILLESPAGRPACVFAGTAEKLSQRGWNVVSLDPATDTSTDKELPSLEEMIATDKKIIPLQKIRGELLMLSELVGNSGLDEGEAGTDYENLMATGSTHMKGELGRCNKPPASHNNATLLSCTYLIGFVRNGEFGHLYQVMSEKYEADPTYVDDASNYTHEKNEYEGVHDPPYISDPDNYTNPWTIERLHNYSDSIKRFDKYAKFYIKYEHLMEDIDNRVREWEMKTKSKIVETFYDKAEAVKDLTTKTNLKNAIKSCDVDNWLYAYDKQTLEFSELPTCLRDANEKYGNSE